MTEKRAENHDGEELTDDEKQQVKLADEWLGEFFDGSTPDQRREKLTSAFRPFVKAGLLDGQTLSPEIENCCSAENKEEFLKRAAGLMKTYILTRRRDVEGVERVAALAEKGRTVINEILDYETTPDGQIIKIHIWPKDKNKVRSVKEIKNLMLSGLSELAEVVKNNANVQTVEAYSHLVKKHPKLVEKLGFTLGEDYATGEGKEGRGSSISRQDFLDRYGRKEE